MTQQVDFMDAWNNVVEVGAVRDIQLISGGIPVDSDANKTYTVTGLVEMVMEKVKQIKNLNGFKPIDYQKWRWLISNIEIHSAGAFSRQMKL